MPIWRINTLSPQEMTKYRQRSQRAINGLNMCKQEAQLIAQERKVADKYKLLAEYMGLAQEGGNSFYNFFVPLNENMVFLLRNANHNNTNPMLYDRHEQLGRPNKRYIVFFKNGNVFSDTPVTFQESEHHVIPYGVNALDNVDSVVAYIDALIKLFTDGETTFPNLPIVSQSTEIDNNQQQLNCNTNMNKKLIRLTESDIHRIVKESVNKILTELDWKTYANAAKKQTERAYGYDWHEHDYNTPESTKRKMERAKRFRQAQDNNFNKKYAQHKSVGRADADVYYSGEDDYRMIDGYPTYHTQFYSDRGDDYDAKLKFTGNRYNSPDQPYEPFYGCSHKEAPTKYEYSDFGEKAKEGDNEFSDYINGNYEYQKGKGWVKK